MSKVNTALEPFLKNFERDNILFKINPSQTKEKLTYGSLTDYQTYLRNLDRLNNGKTIKWLKNALEKNKIKGEINVKEFLNDSTKTFDKFIESNNITEIGGKKIQQISNAFQTLCNVFLCFYLGDFAMDINRQISNKIFAEMVASTAIFVKPVIVEKIVKGEKGDRKYKAANPYASWDNCHSQRCREKKLWRKDLNNGQTQVHIAYPQVGPVIGDNNSNANRYLKMAVSEGMNLKAAKLFAGYNACHIWGVPYDNRAYCSMVNLVLLPSSIAALSDYNPVIQRILQKRSKELYSMIKDKNNQRILFPGDYLKGSFSQLTEKEEEEAIKLYDEIKNKWRQV